MEVNRISERRDSDMRSSRCWSLSDTYTHKYVFPGVWSRHVLPHYSCSVCLTTPVICFSFTHTHTHTHKAVPGAVLIDPGQTLCDADSLKEKYSILDEFRCLCWWVNLYVYIL